MKQAKEQRNLIDNLKTGDEIVSNSGILGKITKLSDQFATLEVSKKTPSKLFYPKVQLNRFKNYLITNFS